MARSIALEATKAPTRTGAYSRQVGLYLTGYVKLDLELEAAGGLLFMGPCGGYCSSITATSGKDDSA